MWSWDEFPFRQNQNTVSVIRNQRDGHPLLLLVSKVHQPWCDRTTDSYSAPWTQQQYDHITQNTNSLWSRRVSEMETNSSFTQLFSCKTSLDTFTMKLWILQPICNLTKIYTLLSSSELSCNVLPWTIAEEQRYATSPKLNPKNRILLSPLWKPQSQLMFILLQFR